MKILRDNEITFSPAITRSKLFQWESLDLDDLNRIVRIGCLHDCLHKAPHAQYRALAMDDDGKKVLGVINWMIDKKEASVQGLATRYGEERKGIASHLVSLACKHMVDNSVTSFSLNCLEDVACFYEKIGMKKTFAIAGVVYFVGDASVIEAISNLVPTML